jgi:hypothetical protein
LNTRTARINLYSRCLFFTLFHLLYLDIHKKYVILLPIYKGGYNFEYR